MSNPMHTKTENKTGWLQEMELNDLNDHVMEETPKGYELEIDVSFGRSK